MGKSWIPNILWPDYTWPRPMQPTISQVTPPTPSGSGPTARRIWGFVHTALSAFSEYYCGWFDIPFDPHIIELPFGLVLKWTDRTSLEEAIAMQLARKAGMPVPKMICCGQHPETIRRISILMTRLPGFSLNNSDDILDVDNEDPWLNELKTCVHAMRLWKSPFGEERICAANGGSIPTQRVSGHIMGPFKDQAELFEFLLAPASTHGFETMEKYNEALECAKKLQKRTHRVMFTHGDFKAHNILIDDDGHLSGFLDWESAGWCPEYWDYTTAMRFGKDSWWYQVCSWMGGDQYSEELASDKALNRLTVDSYIGW